MSPLDRIANVSTLKVNPNQLLWRLTFRNPSKDVLFLSASQQHDVDKLFKVEYKPVVSTSDQLSPETLELIF